MNTSRRTNPVTMNWFMDDSIDAEAGQSLAHMSIAIGGLSELHSHANCSEIIHVLEGRISQRIDDLRIDLSEGQTVLIPKGAIHQTRNTGEKIAILMLAYSSGRRNYTVEPG